MMIIDKLIKRFQIEYHPESIILIIKKISVLYFFGWFVFCFQELMYAKSFVFRCGIV